MVTQPDTSMPDASPSRRGQHVIDSKHEPHRVYQILTPSEEVVEKTAKELAEGSSLLANWQLGWRNFAATVTQVRQWSNEIRDSLRGVLVDIRSNKILFYFVPQSDRYDLDLGDRMTQLEVELNGSAGIGYVETLQVPQRSVGRFVGRRAWVIWIGPGETMFNPAPTASDHEVEHAA